MGWNRCAAVWTAVVRPRAESVLSSFFALLSSNFALRLVLVCLRVHTSCCWHDRWGMGLLFEESVAEPERCGCMVCSTIGHCCRAGEHHRTPLASCSFSGIRLLSPRTRLLRRSCPCDDLWSGTLGWKMEDKGTWPSHRSRFRSLACVILYSASGRSRVILSTLPSRSDFSSSICTRFDSWSQDRKTIHLESDKVALE